MPSKAIIAIGVVGACLATFFFAIVKEGTFTRTLSLSIPDRPTPPVIFETPTHPKAVLLGSIPASQLRAGCTAEAIRRSNVTYVSKFPSRQIANPLQHETPDWASELEARLMSPFVDFLEVRQAGQIIAAWELIYEVTIIFNEQVFDPGIILELHGKPGMRLRHALDMLLEKMGSNLGWTMRDGVVVIDDMERLQKSQGNSAEIAPPSVDPDHPPHPGDSPKVIHLKNVLKTPAIDLSEAQLVKQTIQALENVYEVTIILDNGVDGSTVVSLPGRNITFRQALNILAYRLGQDVEWAIQDDAIHIRKKSIAK